MVLEWHGVLILYIILIFRYDGSNDLASGECYNPQSNTWTNITPMGTKRSCLGESLLIFEKMVLTLCQLNLFAD